MTLPSLLATQADNHPVIPADATWVGVLIIGILALFLAAMVIGPIIRLNMHESDDHAPRH